MTNDSDLYQLFSTCKELGRFVFEVSNIFGNELPGDIQKATEFLSKLPEDKKWNEAQVKKLRELSDSIKDTISALRYEA